MYIIIVTLAQNTITSSGMENSTKQWYKIDLDNLDSTDWRIDWSNFNYQQFMLKQKTKKQKDTYQSWFKLPPLYR